LKTTPNPPRSRLLLASVSPRRRLLLEAMGLNFKVKSPITDELDATAVTVESIVVENALRKARSLKGELESDSIIIGADTLVLCDGKVLSKPTSKDDAGQMLRHLSGRRHYVLTGVALVSHKWGERTSLTQSSVIFRQLPQAEIEKYLLTEEPYDKAGSYAIQGLGSIFIDRIEGSYTNVVGLPVEQLLRDIEALTGVSVFEWFYS
jgi:septum formation protein